MGGFFGVVAREDCVSDLFYGTDYHSHLGTMRGGMAVRDAEGITRFIHDITNSQFRSKFEDDLPRLAGSAGVGVISDYEDQPLIIGSHLGVYAIVTVGIIQNLDELVGEMLKGGKAHFSEMSGSGVNPTELVAMLINCEDTFAEGIARAQELIDGSCSILLLTDEGLYAARDRYGRTPVILGQRDDAHAVTMETSALPNLGYTHLRDLGPGEIAHVTAHGVETVRPANEEMQVCSFLWVYYGYPASDYEGINVEASRNRCGAALARREEIDVDLVAGIPDSGTAHAIGYAHEAGLPYRRPFVKYTPTWPRSFMPQDQRVRDRVAKMKLIPVGELIEGQRMLFSDDSIVRGTQLRDTIQRLQEYGSKEIHMRPACPPLIFGCRWLNFSRSKSEMALATRRAIRALEGVVSADEEVLKKYIDPDGEHHKKMVEHIGKELGLTSLRYQRLDDLIEAIGLPKEKLCTYCWDGEWGPCKKPCGTTSPAESAE